MSKYRFQKYNDDFEIQRMQKEIEDNLVSINALAEEIAKVENVQRCFAEMSIDSSSAQTLALTAGTAAQMDGFTTSDQVQNFTVVNDTLRYNIDRKADFQVNGSFSITYSVNNTNVEGWIYKNGEVVARSELHVTVGTAGDFSNAALSCLISLEEGDYIDVYFEADNNGTLTLQAGNLNIMSVN